MTPAVPTPLQARSERFGQMLIAARRRLDKETVHQLRVSIRRLQAALRLMGQDEERRALRPLMQLAGAVRNCDVALELAHEAGLAPDHAVCDGLRRTRRQQAAALKLAVAAFAPPSFHEDAIQPQRSVLEDFFRAGRRALRHPREKRLHALRLAGKRLRYTIELLAPALDSSTPERLRELKHVQDALGQINDCASARLLTEDEGFHAWLAAEQERQGERFEEYWRRCFGVLGARESWKLFLRPALPAKSASTPAT